MLDGSNMRRAVAGAFAGLAIMLAGPALAQINPACEQQFQPGQTLTSAQLNQAIQQLYACIANVGVQTFNGRNGTVALNFSDVINALGFTPQAPSTVVTSFDGRTGNVLLNSGDVIGALGFTPLGPSAAIGSGTAPNIASGVLTLDYSAGGSYEVTVNQNITSVVLINTPSSPVMWVVNVRFIIAAPGGYTITWPSAWTFPGGGVKPQLTNTPAAVDLFTMIGGWPSGAVDLSSGGQARF